MANVNVELKARDPNPEVTTARCLNLGAVDQGELRQTDTYFMARRGRLKLRSIEDGGSELIAYSRPDGSEARESTYVRAPASQSVLEALGSALSTTVVVSKRRRLYLWEGVRIHLDEVDGLDDCRQARGPPTIATMSRNAPPPRRVVDESASAPAESATAS